MSKRMIVACAAAVLVAGIAGTTAEILPKNPANLPHAVRLTKLEKSIAELQAVVDKLKADLKAAKAEADDAKKQAEQAAFQATLATTWLSQHGSSVLQVVQTFPQHTHGYQQTHVGYDNHLCKNAEAGPDAIPCSIVKGVTHSIPANSDAPK